MARPGRPYKVPEELKSLAVQIKANRIGEVKKIIERNGINSFDPSKRTALIWATFYGKTNFMIWLIENGADVDFKDKGGYTSLHFAAQESRVEELNLLIQNGANPNLKDYYGNTPLWTALINSKGKFEIVKKLIENGADMKIENNYGKSPESVGMRIYGKDFFSLIR